MHLVDSSDPPTSLLRFLLLPNHQRLDWCRHGVDLLHNGIGPLDPLDAENRFSVLHQHQTGQRTHVESSPHVRVLGRIDGKHLQVGTYLVSHFLELLLHDSAGTTVDGSKHHHQRLLVISSQHFLKVFEFVGVSVKGCVFQ